MTPVLPTTRHRLEIQGFVSLDDKTLAEVAPWLRLSPALCTVLIGLGTILASPTILWATVPIAVLGSIFSVHPFTTMACVSGGYDDNG